MEKKLFLAIDVGTQSMRGLIVDTDGNIVCYHKVKYNPPYFVEKSGYAEQDAIYYYQVLCEITKYLKENNPEEFNACLGVSLACFRNTFVCLDENNEPVRRVITWLDKRESVLERKMPLKNRVLFGLVGMSGTVNLIRRRCACNYVYTYEKENWAKTKHYVSIASYLYYKLTGKLVDSVANPVGHVPYNYKKCRWQTKNDLTRPVYEVRDDMLVELIPTGSVVGNISDKCSNESGLPTTMELIAGGSDKACETLGLSVFKKNQAALSFGTSATIQFTTKDYFEPQAFLPSYPAIAEGMYNPEIQIEKGYWLVTWFREQFCYKETLEAEKEGCSVEEILNKQLKNVPAGCNGLMLQPYWSPGVKKVYAKGGIIGFADIHDKMTFYRAIIEGINFDLYQGMLTMERRGHHHITELFVAGGGSQSDEICQITANMFGLPVKRIQTYEVCAIGIALIGFVSKGIFKNYDDGIKSMCHIKDVFEPDMEEHKIYHALYENVYNKMYKKLEKLYKNTLNVLK